MERQSTSETIQWTGDLKDDCTAIWGGLMLRAEEMDRNFWWWAVVQDEGRGELLYSSHEDDRECRSGVVARQRAESCAMDFLNVQMQNNQANKSQRPTA